MSNHVFRNLALTVFAFAMCTATHSAQTRGFDLAAVSRRVQELTQRGQFTDAIAMGKTALNQIDKNVPIDDPARIELVGAVILAQSGGGEIAAAAELCERTLHSLESHDPSSLAVATLRQELANIYSVLGRHVDADENAARAVEIFRARLMPDDPRLANALLTLAIAYRDMAKTDDELHVLRQAQRIVATPTSQLASGTLKLILLQLASFYEKAGEQETAEKYRNQSLGVSVEKQRDETLEFYERGMVALRGGKFVEASHLFEKSLANNKNLFGESSPATMMAKQQLATAYVAMREREKAKPLIADLLESLHTDYARSLPIMNQEELITFSRVAELRFSLCYSYFHQFYIEDLDLAGRMYDSALWSKGIVLENAAAIQSRIAKTKDPEALRLLGELNRERGAFRATNGGIPVEEYRAKTNILRLEKQIVERLDVPGMINVTWRDVQRHLKPDEASIEILRFLFFDGREPTATIYYAALVVRPDSGHPIYVYLGDNTTIEERESLAYSAFVSDQPTDQARHWSPGFWKSLKTALGNAKKLYISPDGVLNNFSFPVIPDTDGEPLIEKYDVRIVSSTRDLLSPRQRIEHRATAVLVGNPSFDLTLKTNHGPSSETYGCSTLQATQSEAQTRNANCPRESSYCPLVESAAEVRAVGQMLCGHNWKIRAFIGDDASKDSIMAAAVRHPAVLHIATHGFFHAARGGAELVDSSMRIDAAMFRTGLVFAGANNAMRDGASVDEFRASVLTAYEISAMDLSGVGLTVLSACKTGLTDTLGGNEVFGLRRALQIAGAADILMSMWSVPSQETSELMGRFYEAWLGGQDEYSALRDAQRAMRKIVLRKFGRDFPYYWGAWVLVAK